MLINEKPWNVKVLWHYSSWISCFNHDDLIFEENVYIKLIMIPCSDMKLPANTRNIETLIRWDQHIPRGLSSRLRTGQCSVITISVQTDPVSEWFMFVISHAYMPSSEKFWCNLLTNDIGIIIHCTLPYISAIHVHRFSFPTMVGQITCFTG